MTKIYDPHILAILTLLCLVLVPMMYKPTEDTNDFTGAAICTAFFVAMLYLVAAAAWVFDWGISYV